MNHDCVVDPQVQRRASAVAAAIAHETSSASTSGA